jgi:hypothetical protein
LLNLIKIIILLLNSKRVYTKGLFRKVIKILRYLLIILLIIYFIFALTLLVIIFCSLINLFDLLEPLSIDYINLINIIIKFVFDFFYDYLSIGSYMYMDNYYNVNINNYDSIKEIYALFSKIPSQDLTLYEPSQSSGLDSINSINQDRNIPSGNRGINISSLLNSTGNRGISVSSLLNSTGNQGISISSLLNPTRNQGISISSLLNPTLDSNIEENVENLADPNNLEIDDTLISGPDFEEFIKSKPGPIKFKISETFLEENKLGFKYKEGKYCGADNVSYWVESRQIELNHIGRLLDDSGMKVTLNPYNLDEEVEVVRFKVNNTIYVVLKDDNYTIENFLRLKKLVNEFYLKEQLCHKNNYLAKAQDSYRYKTPYDKLLLIDSSNNELKNIIDRSNNPS